MQANQTPVVRSLLENDLYKFTMWQALLHSYRSLLRASYNDLPGGITLNPTVVWLHDLQGTSPAPIINFIEGRRVLIANLGADFQDDWSAGIVYQRFDGGGTRHRLRDRDNVSVFVAKVF